MNDLAKKAEPVVEALLEADEVELLEKAGIRVKAIERDPGVASSFDPEVIYAEAQMGALDDVRALGRRIFKRWNREAYTLMCGADPDDADSRKQLRAALGLGDVAVAAALTSVLVSLGLAPALGTVVAALVVKRFFNPAYEEFCGSWKESLDKE